MTPATTALPPAISSALVVTQHNLCVCSREMGEMPQMGIAFAVPSASDMCNVP